jgi:hypothetical protein
MQLSKNCRSFNATGKIFVKKLVGAGGFEPPTLRLSSACSNQLSYAPTLVEPTRIELVTSCLQSRRSPS